MSGILPEALESELLAIQAALLRLRARVRTGSAAGIESASTALAQRVDAAAADCATLRQYLKELGAHSFAQAASVLRTQGQGQQATRMLRLRSLIAAIARQSSGMDVFVRECLDILDVTRSRAGQRQPHGRLLGSA